MRDSEHHFTPAAINYSSCTSGGSGPGDRVLMTRGTDVCRLQLVKQRLVPSCQPAVDCASIDTRMQQSNTQALVERGYVVVKVNNRGSIGYNHRFYHLDDHGHGTKDLQDIVAAGDLLVSKYGVPRSQLAVMGGSYGGYLVLAALAFRSEAFAAGIDVFGVTDWVTTLDNMPPWWIGYREYFHTEIGHPTLDRAHLREISPAYFPEKIQRPLMVVQGANDPRVRAEWSDALVSSLREHGRSVEYLYFPDEGHGFSKPANRQTLIVRALSFLARVFADSAPAR